MMGSFRRVFHPTVEEQIQDYELLLRLHKEQLGHCSTCKNHISSDMPGYVTDYGDCTVDSPLFPAKVCGLEDKICPLYVERSVESLGKEIERLKRETPAGGRGGHMMDTEKLIEDLRISCAGNQHNIMSVAATALSTLQAENAKLRAELERMKKIMRDNGIMVIPSKYPGGPSEWNIPKPNGQKED